MATKPTLKPSPNPSPAPTAAPAVTPSAPASPPPSAPPLPTAFSPLREQLLAAAHAFSHDAQHLSLILHAIVQDVERANAEPLTILPVAHHSPTCALHIVQHLRAHPPKVVFIEMCEDLLPLIDGLRDCKLPVALQAFAHQSSSFPEAWLPVSVVSPLSEFSAEYQAIAWALNHTDTHVVFVDRSVDHVFQWIKQEDDSIKALLPQEDEDSPSDDESRLHSTSVGLEVGSVEPTFPAFRDFLLQNARVNHFSEWWDLYIEQPTLYAPFDTWRQTFFLIGSLIRRLGTRSDKHQEYLMRERYMWTRMKQHLRAHNLSPADAVYICGAAHASSDVPEWGTLSDATWDIPPKTSTEWLYGFVPSAYSAIEHQFAHPRSTLSLAETTWTKALTALQLQPFSLSPKSKAKGPAKPKAPSPPPASADGASDGALSLFNLLSKPPALALEDRDQLLNWCTQIVDLARKNKYLASTADAIAIYETSILLAGIRGRRQPSPYDFIDAAVTCLEKMEPPGHRDVQTLCAILIGTDRVGQVGYASAPPLLQDVYDRLAPLGVTPKKSTVTRWLADFRDPATAARKPLSDLLWRLFYLLPSDGVARPIMGERKLGGKQLQESWDIKIHGPQQAAVIRLAYEGVTIEQVLELRIRKKAFHPNASTLDVLSLAEDAILFLDNQRLNAELGHHAVHLLTLDMGAQSAVAVFDRIRRFVHYFRATPHGLPDWLKDFVARGYQHYATLLPKAFQERSTSPEQLSGMLSFLFTLESLALTLGCNKTQVRIAIQQATGLTSDPPKLGLLWAAEWLLQLRDAPSVRAEFDLIFQNPISFTRFPEYLSGFILALHFTPLVAPVAVDLLGRAFSDLPDAVLLPWLPNLVSSLKEFSFDILPALFKEAFNTQPRSLKELDTWSPPWLTQPSTPPPTSSQAAQPASPRAPTPTLSDDERAARALLFSFPDTASALSPDASPSDWQQDLAVPEAVTSVDTSAAPQPTSAALASPDEAAARALLNAHPDTLNALSPSP